MQTSQHFCYKHSSGEDIYLFLLSNVQNSRIYISNYGAIVQSFIIMRPDGSENDIVLGFEKMEEYLSPEYLKHYPWFGCAIGRYGNRIRNASFQIDGVIHQLSKNLGNGHLHGGHSGFDKKIWQMVSHSPSLLELQYTSPDREEGYPGNLLVTLRYHLNDSNEFSYEYTATTDKPTAVNLTHHGYFNLDNGKSTIEEHEVKIEAAEILEQDDGLVATGNFVPVKNTHFDFNQMRKINAAWNKESGFDQSFVIDNKNKDLSLVATVISSRSATKMEVFSTEPVVHFYTGKWIPALRGKNGTMYGPSSGFCLETQVHPNAINIPHFPNTVLRPGETYHHKTMYRLSHVAEK